jgi:hypothetical protein
MQHLDPERLAAFDHDAPSAAEQAHLDACAACRQERAAYTQLRVFAGTPATFDAPPLTEWSALSGALQREGLIASRSVRRLPSWLRTAAAVALMAGGVALGRISAGEAVLPTGRGADVSASLIAQDGPDFDSVEQASAVLERAQRDYQRASMWLSSHDTTVNAQAVYRARLAALDQMMMASRAGLYEAPQDPVLNQYYLAAYTAREATLRQLGASLSVDRVMERF